MEKKENIRIEGLFNDLFDGDPWIDGSILGTLENITAEKALLKIPPIPNSTWEIVNHMIDWRLNVLRRVHGEVIVSPDHNYFNPIHDSSQSAWEETLERLKDSQVKWTHFLKTMNTDIFDTVYPTNGMSYYQHIHGILQHDAYHLGQIVWLVKYA